MRMMWILMVRMMNCGGYSCSDDGQSLLVMVKVCYKLSELVITSTYWWRSHHQVIGGAQIPQRENESVWKMIMSLIN